MLIVPSILIKPNHISFAVVLIDCAVNTNTVTSLQRCDTFQLPYYCSIQFQRTGSCSSSIFSSSVPGFPMLYTVDNTHNNTRTDPDGIVIPFNTRLIILKSLSGSSPLSILSVRVSSSHSGLLECYSLSIGNYLRVFRRIRLSSSSGIAVLLGWPNNTEILTVHSSSVDKLRLTLEL
jgi:hypothetical protein